MPKLDQGYQSAREASIDAMSRLGGTVVSITLVILMSVFIPVSFMGGTSIYSSVRFDHGYFNWFLCVERVDFVACIVCLVLETSFYRRSRWRKKMSWVDRFHTSFNAAYDSVLKKYKKRVVFFIHKKWLSFGLVAGSILLLVFFMKVTPTGMVPTEDTGTIMGAVT